jgi:Mpp10 protein
VLAAAESAPHQAASLAACSWLWRSSRAGQRPLNSALELDLDLNPTYYNTHALADSADLRGARRAGQRPLNSALELDLDFERTMAPPPAPTEEGTATLEETIKCAAPGPPCSHLSISHHDM